MIPRKNKMIGGVLLIAGTTIGGGILALPVVLGQGGFLPSIALFFLFWVYMTFTAFCMLEVNLWMGENVNLITMAKHTLGKLGEGVSWAAYLFLLYLLTTAYLAGGGPIVSRVVSALIGYDVPNWVGGVPLLGVFGFFVYEGTQFVDYLNRLMMVGLVVAYGALILFLAPHIEVGYLSEISWPHLWIAISTVATSFGFHIIIPTLTTYMHRDVKGLRQAILYGSLITLAVYLVWIFGTLGSLPLEEIIGGYHTGIDGAALIVKQVGSKRVIFFAQAFSFFAIMTSFLGVTLSLSDFLADGLHIRKTPLGRLFLFALTFTPPLIFISTYPKAFLTALQFAGTFGVIILLGLFPPLMVWAGRYHKGYVGSYRAPGGRFALFIAILLSLFFIGIEIIDKIDLSGGLFK